MSIHQVPGWAPVTEPEPEQKTRQRVRTRDPVAPKPRGEPPARQRQDGQEPAQQDDELETEAAGISAEAVLAGGDPGTEIAAAAERERCDLVAMSVHGHKGVQDLLRGSVANEVRHRTTVPVLMVRGTPRRVKPA